MVKLRPDAGPGGRCAGRRATPALVDARPPVTITQADLDALGDGPSEEGDPVRRASPWPRRQRGVRRQHRRQRRSGRGACGVRAATRRTNGR
ncbi:MAG: hypothetical protein R3F43_14185 [bacterium]